MRLLTVVPEIEGFLSKFRPCLSRRQFRHFCRYILGLMASDRKSIKRIASFCTDRVDQSNLNRFMHSNKVDDESIQSRMMELVWRDVTRSRPAGRMKVYLIIDDSLLEKFGRHMEGTGYLFSTKDGKSILCHDIVTSCMVVNGKEYPVDVRLYVREEVCMKQNIQFKTRIELALELINFFTVPDNTDVIVLFDSWYLCSDIVDAVHAKGWHYVSESKSNRRVVFDDDYDDDYYDGGMDTSIKELPVLFRHMFSDHAIEGELYSSFQTNVRMGGLGSINLLMKVKMFQKDPDEMHFLVSDIMEMDTQSMVLTYGIRHKIEEFYRNSKQSLGLGEYMVRDIMASNRHWRLVFVTYTLLILLKETQNLLQHTIGELCDWIRERCVESLMSKVYSMTRENLKFEHIVQTFR